MPIEIIRRKLQLRQTKSRWEALCAVACGLIMSVLFARAAIQIPVLVPRLGAGLLALWGIYFAWQAYRWMWPHSLRSEATPLASLQFYRSELERRRDYARRTWRRSGLIFACLGVAMLAGPGLIQALLHAPRMLLNALPLFALLILWFCFFFPFRRHQLDSLQVEIDEVDALERSNR